ncbi:MAG: hypothetical protein AAGL19_01610 [Pseudomonadota bacterium]
MASFTKVSQRLPGGMQRKKTIYVAETDENGRVMCVWVDEHGQRSARPFNPKRNRFNMTDEARFSGARPEAIKSWLAKIQ